MKNPLRIRRFLCLMVGLILVLPLGAQVPKKQPLGRYSELWTKSAFTIPPIKEVVEIEEENPLEEYTLAGACEVEGGWFVVLINKKERDKRIRLHPGEKNEEGFEVVKVDRGSSYMDTRVEIKNRSGKIGAVEYDEKFIVLKKATPRAPAGKQPTVKPGQKPTTPQRPTTTSKRPSTSSSSGGKPRVRRIPSPPSR
ncbi:MAG: hypothetical protein CMN02_03120 [Roseibacillus sp.]|nr:hypothetical protein [Roseibacillus sp.]|tara:strand:- start:529 stop:1116 length:588 start_codon:yes stop_codon:yes gene_type:complete